MASLSPHLAERGEAAKQGPRGIEMIDVAVRGLGLGATTLVVQKNLTELSRDLLEHTAACAAASPHSLNMLYKSLFLPYRLQTH